MYDDEFSYSYWCGRLSEAMNLLLAAQNLAEEEIARRVAQKVAREYRVALANHRVAIGA